MTGISNDIIFTLMHSTWQSFVLYLFFVAYKKSSPNHTPAKLKSILLVFIIGQPIISIFTFLLLRLNPTMEFLNTDLIIRATSTPIYPWLINFASPIYLVIVTFKLGYVRLKWKKEKLFLTEGLSVPSETFLTLANQTLERFSNKKGVSFFVHPYISSPLTLGFWKPIVVFPVALLNNLTIEETVSLIAHELSHIQRNDFISNQMNIILKQVYFFNPFFQKLSSSFMFETETTCDQFVLKAQDPLVYALALKKTAEFSIQTNHVAALCATGKTNVLAYRISQFKHLKAQSHTSNRGSLFSIFTVLLLISATTFFLGSSIRKIKSANNPIAFSTRTAIKAPLTIVRAGISRRKKSNVPTKSFSKALKQSITNQEDLFLSQPSLNVQSTSNPETNEKQMLVQEESNGQRTTTAYSIKNEQGEILKTWLWTIEENIETTDSIYSDTLAPFHEYVEDLR